MKKLSFIQRLLLLHFLLLILITIIGSNTQINYSFKAQAQGVITPTLYCLGACPTLPLEEEPSEPPITDISMTPMTSSFPPPSGSGVPTTAPTTAPTTIPTITSPTPCPSTTTQSGKHFKHKKKHRGDGGFIEAFFRFLFMLIQLLLGQGGITPPSPGPAPDPGCNPVLTPEPTEPTAPTSAVEPTAVPQPPTGGTEPTTATQPTTGPVTSCTQADIQKLVDSVSEANIRANLQALVQDDSKPVPNELISRHVSAPGNRIKADWMNQKLASYGLETVNQSFPSDEQELINPIGRLNGTDPNSIIAATAHIDSISEDEANVAPGASDDGSGIVAAMEAGRVLKGFQQCLKSSVDIVGFNDEEEGMEGSATYIQQLSGKAFKGALNMDMVGYAPDGECMKAHSNLSVDQPLAQKMVEMNTKYNIGYNISTGTYKVEDIDNANFWSANLPSVYINECATETDSSAYPGYHSTEDTTSYINYSQITKLTKVLVATLAELASQ